MKRILSKHIILALGCLLFVLGGSSDSCAKNKRHLMAQESLLNSLESLKESAQVIADKNRWYHVQITELEEKISFLNRELGSMDQYHSEWSTQDARLQSYLTDSKKQTTFYDKNFSRLQAEFLAVEDDMMRLNREIDRKSSEIEKVSGSLKTIESKIAHYRQFGMANGDDVFDDPAIIQLVNDRKYLQEQISQLEDEHRQLKKKYARPLSQLLQQRDHNRHLKQQTAIARDELRILFEKEKEIVNEIQIYQSKKDSDFLEKKRRIGTFISRQKELTGIIKQVKAKVDSSKLQPEREKEEMLSLEQNLATIRDENASLKSQLLKLQNSLSMK